MANVLKTITGTITGLGATTIFSGATCLAGFASKRINEGIDELKGDIKSNAETAVLKNSNEHLEREKINIANQLTNVKMENIKLKDENERLKAEALRLQTKNDLQTKNQLDLFKFIVDNIANSPTAKEEFKIHESLCARGPLGNNYSYCTTKGNETINLLGKINGFATKIENNMTKPNQ